MNRLDRRLVLWSLALFVAFARCGGPQETAGPSGATALSAKHAASSVRRARAPIGWEQTYHDAGHTGFNGQERTLKRKNVASLQLQWAQSVAGGVTGFALDQGVIFAQGQGSSQGAVLAALDAQSGTQLWNVTTGNDGYGQNGTVVVGQGLVFGGCSANLTNQEQGICAFDEASGAPVWSFYDNCGCLPPAYVSAPPVYSNGDLYFGYDDGGSGSPNALRAVDAATGNQLWAYGGVSLGTGPPAAAGNYVYASCGQSVSDFVCALNASNGALAWSTQVGNQPNIAISVANNVVYAATEYNGTNSEVAALDGTTGTILWTYVYRPKGGGTKSNQPPAEANGVVYVAGTNGLLYALNASNGQKTWAYGSGGTDPGVNSAPSVANNVVYVNGGGSTGSGPNTTAHNAANGKLLWSSPSNHGTLNPPPIVANGILYFASPGDGTCSSICAYSLSGAMRR